jgi:hypothetical protein
MRNRRRLTLRVAKRCACAGMVRGVRRDPWRFGRGTAADAEPPRFREDLDGLAR